MFLGFPIFLVMFCVCCFLFVCVSCARLLLLIWFAWIFLMLFLCVSCVVLVFVLCCSCVFLCYSCGVLIILYIFLWFKSYYHCQHYYHYCHFHFVILIIVSIIIIIIIMIMIIRITIIIIINQWIKYFCLCLTSIHYVMKWSDRNTAYIQQEGSNAVQLLFLEVEIRPWEKVFSFFIVVLVHRFWWLPCW